MDYVECFHFNYYMYPFSALLNIGNFIFNAKIKFVNNQSVAMENFNTFNLVFKLFCHQFLQILSITPETFWLRFHPL